jgi:hypothetical protein
MSRAPAGTCLSLIAATALALAGCGGDDSTTTTSASAPTAKATTGCLQDAGLPVKAEAPTSDDMLNVLYINEDELDQVYLAFMKSPDAAERIAHGLGGLAQQAGGNAGAEVVDDTVVLARAHDTTQDQVDQVKGCLTG